MGIGRFIASFKSTNNEKYDIETADRIYKFRNLDDYDLSQRITYLRDFEAEKKKLIDYILKTQQLGENAFDGKESVSFGSMTKIEWNNMIYKHLDHHLCQFGV